MNMEILRTAILGIVQGLTEFLPVSSSGHLEIVKFLMGDHAVGEQSLMLTIILHAATALGTIFVFRKDVWNILSDLVKKPWNEGQEFALKVIISMIPAGLIGFFLEPVLEQLFEGRIAFVGCMLLVTAVLLFIADRPRTNERVVTRWNALLIGIAQAVAILPGISRSGATIATSLYLGIDRYKAARFSFLMVVPLILGKMSYDLLKEDVTQMSVSSTALAVGFLTAFVSGIIACKWMIALVRRSRLKWFGVYCCVAGVFAIILSFVSIA
jgi:undecaprenyl-diphosphatase